jgi:hypothetical protein
MEFYQSNMSYLKKANLELYNKIKKLELNREKYNVIKTKNNSFTLQIINNEQDNKKVTLLHSKYNPKKEAEQFASNQCNGNKKINILYGFGLGYHVEKILQKIGNSDILYVIDLNLEVFRIALENNNLEKVLKDNKLKLIITEDEKYISTKLSELLDLNAEFTAYPPSIKTIPNKYKYFKFIIENWNIKKSLNEKWVNLLKENHHKNKHLKSENVGMLFNKYNNKPIIIVSAGPSLNNNKHLLKQLVGKALIFAVGSALKPLLVAGIKPDLFCIIDPQDVTYKQIEGYEDIDIPLVYLNTASAYTVSKYRGPKYVAFNDSRYLLDDNYIIDSGGSVATAIMDMAIKFGGNPIVFVGQDLAYINNKHHADGKMYGGKETLKSLPNMRKVEGQNGKMLDTTLGLISFKYWIENKIKDNRNIEFINCSEGGAIIDGCKHIKLINFLSYIK